MKTEQNEPHAEAAIHSLLEVHAAQGGGSDRNLCQSVFDATTRKKAESRITPFPRFHSPGDSNRILPKVVAIILLFCGIGLATLITFRPASQNLANAADSTKRDSTGPLTIFYDETTPEVWSQSVAHADPKVSQKTGDISFNLPKQPASADPILDQSVLPSPTQLIEWKNGVTPSIVLNELVPSHGELDEPTIAKSRLPNRISDKMATATIVEAKTVLAVVNGELITSTKLDEFSRSNLACQKICTEITKPNFEPIEQLITDRLLRKEFDRRGGQVQQAYLDQQIKELVDSRFDRNHTKFYATLKQHNLSLQELQGYLESNIIEQALVAEDESLLDRLFEDADIVRLE